VRKQLLSWLFALGMGYLFVEVQRFLSGTNISGKEWVGFIVITGSVVLIWVRGEKLDKSEKEKQREENRQLMNETVDKVLKDAGLKK
jgi:hypothetical protein